VVLFYNPRTKAYKQNRDSYATKRTKKPNKKAKLPKSKQILFFFLKTKKKKKENEKDSKNRFLPTVKKESQHPSYSKFFVANQSIFFPFFLVFPLRLLLPCLYKKTKKETSWRTKLIVFKATERLALTLIFRLHVAVTWFF